MLYPVSQVAEGILALSGGRLASRLEGGAGKCSVRTFAPLDRAQPDTIAFLAQPQYRHQVKDCRAAVVVLTEEDRRAVWGDEDPGRPLVITENPYAWFAWALQLIVRRDPPAGHIDPRAVVEEGAQVDPAAVVRAYAVIKKGARVGARAVIHESAYVGEGSVIGEDTVLYPRAVIYHGCRIGARCILHSGCVIGADGFGFAPFRGEWVKIPQLGGVTIGDDVEIGANTTVDRGALEDTRVGTGTKLDNQIQLGHNDQVGEHSVLCACTGVAGSTKIGSHCVIAGGAGINGHISIPDGSTVGPFTGVLSWKEGQKQQLGFMPAQDPRDFHRTAAMLVRLPKMRARLQELEKEIESLRESIARAAD